MTETEPEKPEEPEKVCIWGFNNYDDHFATSCGTNFTFPSDEIARAVIGPCPKCGLKIYCV